MPERQLVEIDVKPGPMADTQSGVARLKPRILGALVEPERRGRTAAIVMHPTNNFLGHPLLGPMAERGIGMLGLNSRFLNNDAALIMERVIQDLGAGVSWLRRRGYDKVCLIGFSGGAAMSCFYQAEAERPSITHTPAGDAVAFDAEEMQPADGVALIAAHLGRSRLLLDWIDPSVTDDADAGSCDPLLDMYAQENAPPYSEDFLTRYREAQRQRRDRIEAWAHARLDRARGRGLATDEAFVVHRTFADPRFMDLSLDANDREPGGIWGNALEVNYSANAIGRYTSLTAFMSQWSSQSQADGPTNIARTSVPVSYMELTGDASAFPSTTKHWVSAIEGRVRGGGAHVHAIRGGDHYLKKQGHLAEAADALAGWMETV
jgi:hypothetical protein